MLESSKKRAMAQGTIGGSSFKGARRSGGDSILSLGDEWTFPATYEVCTNTNLGSDGVEYIFIETAPGVEKQFYPSTLDKNVEVYTPAKNTNSFPTPTGKRVGTKGNVIDFLKEFVTIDEMMQALRNRRVKITNVETVATSNYNDPRRTRNTQIYTIDFVDEVEGGSGKKGSK